ncbi:putative hydrolase of the HAD superfamily [Gracilibacillus orientalis]|uniref:Putative hydrolase of the HAD superfamily n=1 Tax=Gracilibacillus orientalis TaxID=334253 RepID=A0A1I4JUL7_9BACI|nr:HAD family hydrolase [Gracilibacillus orientalis]SFL70285.1 putative hydrolase of the HAD superfamily [Gracilibacillus orientalis]
MQTIIFDVDDTLYDQLQPFRNAVHQQLDTSFTDSEIGSLYKTSRKYSDEVFEKYMSGEITALELQTYRMTKACEEFEIALSYDQAVRFQDVYLSELKKIQLLDPMKRLLEQLSKQGKQLAVLTNGEFDHQMMKVKQLQLTNWIPTEHIFISGDLGYSKPSLEVFNHIEKKLKIEKQETLYIGDSFEHDIFGAKRAGWKAAWMNHRKRKVSQHDIIPDYIVERPDDILVIASEWSS